VFCTVLLRVFILFVSQCSPEFSQSCTVCFLFHTCLRQEGSFSVFLFFLFHSVSQSFLRVARFVFCFTLKLHFFLFHSVTLSFEQNCTVLFFLFHSVAQCLHSVTRCLTLCDPVTLNYIFTSLIRSTFSKNHAYVLAIPSSNFVLDCHPTSFILETSINLRGVPSGLVASQMMSPSWPTAF
jgi:hypothetical protein